MIIVDSYIALMSHSVKLLALNHYYTGFSSAAIVLLEQNKIHVVGYAYYGSMKFTQLCWICKMQVRKFTITLHWLKIRLWYSIQIIAFCLSVLSWCISIVSFRITCYIQICKKPQITPERFISNTTCINTVVWWTQFYIQLYHCSIFMEQYPMSSKRARSVESFKASLKIYLVDE